jgi:hypothetical protein
MAIDRPPYGVYLSPDCLIEEINKRGVISLVIQIVKFLDS